MSCVSTPLVCSNCMIIHTAVKHVLGPADVSHLTPQIESACVALHLFFFQGRDKDPAHQNCVLVKCQEDKRTFFFDMEQVCVCC